ncbi:hypothetical protein K1719_046226 [Acacia pycnantha]|nr:hypothetical protein K1719_046226 [Acacia pycnantha]
MATTMVEDSGFEDDQLTSMTTDDAVRASHTRIFLVTLDLILIFAGHVHVQSSSWGVLLAYGSIVHLPGDAFVTSPALLFDVPRDTNITAEVMKSLNIPRGVRGVLFRTLNTDRE